MVRLLARTLLAALLLVAPPAAAEDEGPARHEVQRGQSLGRIAKRYSVAVDALCKANGIRRKDPLRPGQVLWIPGPDDPDGSETAELREAAAPNGAGAPVNGLQTLLVPGAPEAYYYEPVGPGRMGTRPILVYLHGRGGRPASDCQRWAPVARRFGWVLCPSGQEDRGGGQRGWDNNWPGAERVVMSAVGALKQKFKKRVQTYGNTLIGFSEGAYVAMNVGVRQPRTFNRWLILAADADYWGGSGVEALKSNRGQIKRVYLITGELDGVHESTGQVERWLTAQRVPTRVSMPSDMGHEVPLQTRAAMYRAALSWLDKGTGEPRGGGSRAKAK